MKTHNGWSSDGAYFIDQYGCWMTRAGLYSHGSLTGNLYFDRNSGVAYSTHGSRLVLAP